MQDWELEEWQAIHERRQAALNIDPPKDPKQPPKNLIGLALSGGGIRSALYNDGFLQGLSHRGFLRFVDFMASVSGGGYIAGHLTAQAETRDEQVSTGQAHDAGKATDKPGFHDDPGKGSKPPRWHLGRHPLSGTVDPKRLAAVGGYLSRPLEVLPAYLWSCFFSATFYIGSCGILATLAALFWRSFDDPTFRIMYLDVLELRIGDELLIAFIPALLFLGVLVVIEIAFSSYRWIAGFSNPSLQRKHFTTRACSLIALVLACLTSIAIFLGNGTTNVSANAGSSLQLNHYAQWLAVIAGGLQVLVFFGSDKLFRSERQEAKSWQKHLQRFIAVGVASFLIFSMIHWMGRENISKYVDNREPYLELGDVEDWKMLKNVFANSKDPQGSRRVSLDLVDHLPAHLKLNSRWDLAKATRRWSGLSYVDDEKPNAEKPWMLEQRLLGAMHAYRLAMLAESNSDVKPASPQIDGRLRDYMTVRTADSKIDVGGTMKHVFNTIKALRYAQETELNAWNKTLQDPKFTVVLLQRPLGSDTSQENPQPASTIPSILKKLLAAENIKLSDNEKKSVAAAAGHNELLGRKVGNELQLTASEQLSCAENNRLLLEALFPGAVRKKEIPSTYLIPSYDQRARRSWLGFWLLLATIGAIGGVFRHQIATVFHFYRRQLGLNFLIRTDHRSVSRSETPLSEIDPTADGLPYPLMLAASMEPVRVNGGYTISSKTFMFTPKFCGDLSDDVNRIRSDQVALSRKENAEAVTLADAVTLSGAAVTPFMTKNRCLSLLVDLFNTGLSMQVYRTDKTCARVRRANNLGWIAIGAIAIAFAGLIDLIADDWPSTLAAFALAWIVGGCVLYETGVPHFLKLLLVPREVGPIAKPTARERAAKSFYVADGGFTDYLGVSALLQRRCELMVVSDAGANVGENHLGTLARMCEKAAAEMGVLFFDLDHEAPIDFGRLKFDERRLVHQPYICMRVRYPDAKEALLIYCQMAISETDPIEIQQIRHRFPTFPDEPTANQFYTDDQVSAYRLLGYHIASKVCRELERWCIDRQAPMEDTPVPGPSGEPASEFQRYRAELSRPSPFSIRRASDGVPHFDTLQERLLTGYRLACYEEVSYNKDDIFSEAIWPMSTYAFPNFRKHAQAVGIDDDPQAFAESWLRVYESSADVRSAYRKAVLEDINVMDSEAESFCNALFESFVCAVNTSGEEPQHPQGHLLAAHLTVIATACQEVHRGRPHAAFQIGGRRKLIQLCSSVAQTIDTSLSLGRDHVADHEIRLSLSNIVAEISELERSVFLGGEHVTTISFAQCICVMWGRLARQAFLNPADLDAIAQRARKTFSNSSGTPTESRMVRARHELDRGLRKIQLDRILGTLCRLWYLGFFNTDVGIVFSDRSPIALDQSQFHRDVAAIVNIRNANQAAQTWLGQYDDNDTLQRAYAQAIASDNDRWTLGTKSQIANLWQQLQSTATTIQADAASENLMTAHLAAIATTIMRGPHADVAVAKPLISAGKQQRLVQCCGQIAELIAKQKQQSGGRTIEVGLRFAQSRFVRTLRALESLEMDDWSAQTAATFCRLVNAVWTAEVRGDRAGTNIKFKIPAAEDALSIANPSDDVNEKERVERFDKMVCDAFSRSNSDVIHLLICQWYVSLLSTHELEAAIAAPQSRTKSPVVKSAAGKSPKA